MLRELVLTTAAVLLLANAVNAGGCTIEGQLFTTCASACPLTCSEPGPIICSLPCVVGCECPSGSVLDEAEQKCVPLEDCPIDPCANFTCPTGSQCKVYEGEAYCEPSCSIANGGCEANETCSLVNVTCVTAPCPPVVECKPECTIEGQVFTECGTACPLVCHKPVPRFCTLQCVIGCQCPNGMVLDEIQQKCVASMEECSVPICDIAGQEYTTCGTACPLTCSQPDPVPCTRQCVVGCQCPSGTVLDEAVNECVTVDKCSNGICDIEGQEYTTCGTACPLTCTQPEPVPCTRQCVIGCQCPSGTVLDETADACVPLDECSEGPCANFTCPTGSQCKVFEGEAYCEPSCSIDNGGCEANETCSLVTVRCRDRQAPCPPEVKCVPQCSIEGQVYMECGTACPRTCSNPRQQNCVAMCVEECQCPSEMLFDELQIKCVARNKCFDPCANFSCPTGHQCKHLEGVPYCEASCSIDNGGCAANEICSLETITCKSEPCLPVVKCELPDCPPNCSHEYCSQPGNSDKPCSRTDKSGQTPCPDRCYSTFCKACYYSETPRNTFRGCTGCRTNSFRPRCLEKWADCVEERNAKRNKCSGSCISAENFRCYDHPLC